MGDEDGSTFIINTEDGYKVYRIDGWYNNNISDSNFITYEEMINKFNDWELALNVREDDASLKYKYIYMGFGNGLCVRKELYDEYKKYLDQEIEQFAIEKNLKVENYKADIIFNVWYESVVKMTSDKGIKLF